MNYPRRLIEVDLPIKEISAHARREKSIRHGHISTLHIWWARRPLAACRAVICASLWPDPADDLCPQGFRDAAALVLAHFAEQVRSDEKLAGLCASHWSRWKRTNPASLRPDNPACWPDMRYGLLDFIADFANWDASTVPCFVDAARILTQASYLALGDLDWRMPVTPLSDDLGSTIAALPSLFTDLPRPLLADPFAGGGAIPLEALRVGADVYASDLNPLAVLLNKVALEYIPRYGQQLADEVRRWGLQIKNQAEKELGRFYPDDPDGARPIAYLWARTVKCEGPGCGAEVPLLRSLWLAKRCERPAALQLVADRAARHIDIKIIEVVDAKDVGEGTVRRGAALCPICGFTTPVTSVRRQLATRCGGTNDARLFCVVTTRPNQEGRSFRRPTERDIRTSRMAAHQLRSRMDSRGDLLARLPNENICLTEIRRISLPLYGMTTWGHLFSDRQALSLATLSGLVRQAHGVLRQTLGEGEAAAVGTCLALAVDRVADRSSSVTRWDSSSCNIGSTFSRQAIGMVWDFAEVSPFAEASGDWSGAVEWVSKVIEREAAAHHASGQARRETATANPLPDDAADVLFTDPPYYDAVPYAHLSDFFHVWLTRSLGPLHGSLFNSALSPKDQEIVVDRPHRLSGSHKDVAYYERELVRAFSEGRRVLKPEGIACIVFASKSTASWEAILQAVIDAGLVITGSWPVDTELGNRVAARGQSRLASSIHLICRARPDAEQAQFSSPSVSFEALNVGDWRDVLSELPSRIRIWMERLADVGVYGADAIFACLGPALEIFSRYRRVEKASGEQVTLREYLEQVWAAVSREALTTIFEGEDTASLEEDARLTAIWFWVLRSTSEQDINTKGDDIDDDPDPDESNPSSKRIDGYSMEFDAARKLAQGLGADLQRLSRPGGIVTIKGNVATLNAVVSREPVLIAPQLPLWNGAVAAQPSKQTTPTQPGTAVMRFIDARRPGLFDEPKDTEVNPDQPFLPTLGPSDDVPTLLGRLVTSGHTRLDRLHQAMLLFGRSQSSLLGPLLSETGMGSDTHFWRLAQALSALYPSGSNEKRWVDGVLGRKRALGF